MYDMITIYGICTYSLRLLYVRAPSSHTGPTVIPPRAHRCPTTSPPRAHRDPSARPAAPTVAWADWRNSLGPNSIAEVGFDGQAAADIVWPDLVGLRGQVALAQLLLVSPDGAGVVDSTPPVSLIF